MSFDRKAYAKELVDRIKESNDSKDSTGMFASILKPDAKVPMWNCKEGKHYIDIIPFIAGENHPRVKQGKPAHNLDIWVHRGVGPNEANYVCPARNYKLECPICEYRKELADSEDADEDLIKSLLPKRRVFYNIIVYDTQKEEELGIQVWEVAHWFMEQKLLAIAERPRQGGFINWADPDEGKQVMFTRKGTGATNTSFEGHVFVDRDYKISDDDLKNAYCLDELIVIPTYEELKDAFWGRKVKEEQREEKTEVRRERGIKKDLDKEEADCDGFGKDTDNLDDCQKCKKYEDCVVEFERIAAEEKKKKEEEEANKRPSRRARR